MTKALRNLTIVAVAATAAATLMRQRLRRYVIAESSMAPALQPGDWVIAAASASPPRRGDVIVFAHPDRLGFDLVKRVIGLPGEHVALTGGRVYIDGFPLAEPWADGATHPDDEWHLTEDEIFVLGDARSRSAADGRVLGPLPVSAAMWRVRLRYWPATGIGSVSRPGGILQPPR